ncbi:MAG: hypothetical protein ABSA65_02590 [Acidimicrobiales bacterium]
MSPRTDVSEDAPLWAATRGRTPATCKDIDLVAFFVVTTAHGPSWDTSRGIREQDAWDEHAAFMDALVDDGFVVLGGPLGNGERALLVIEASDEREIEARLRSDPWSSMGLLRIGATEPWTVWLDGRQREQNSS